LSGLSEKAENEVQFRIGDYSGNGIFLSSLCEISPQVIKLSRLELMNLLYTIYVWLTGCAAMKLDGKQIAAVVLAVLLVLISAIQLGETVSAVRYWWHVNHATVSEYVVPHWWTQYTITSALFAPVWLTCTGAALLFVRRRPILAIIALSTFLIVEPISCASAPSLSKESGGFLGLEELPFADAERVADSNHLLRIDERIKIHGNSTGEFPTSPEALKNAVGNLAHEISPYEHGGKQLDFDLVFVLDKGVPYSTNPERPGIVYYSVNPSGTQYTLTISGLNAPVSDRASMMKEGTFVGSKQPWGGLLATEESLFQR
jgi:hypothetical protein